MLNGQVPENCKIDIDGQATIMSKYPLSLELLKKGKVVQITNGVLIPEKGVSLEGDVFVHNCSIRTGYVAARYIKRIKGKSVGSRNHHRFGYKIKTGTIFGGKGVAA